MNGYIATVVSATDYEPFGLALEGRSLSNEEAYRWGFNGKELDDDFFSGAYDFDARIYHSKIGRWLAKDPVENKYPAISTYAFVANSPLIFIDPNGKWLVDAQGRIIATFEGGRTDNTVILIDGNEVEVSITIERYYIYTNKGTPVLAERVVRASFEKISVKGENVKIKQHNIKVEGTGLESNCHGLTFGKGQFRISDELVPTILEENDYEEAVQQTESNISVFYPKEGGDLDNPNHSTSRNDDGTYNSDDGDDIIMRNTGFEAAKRGSNIDDSKTRHFRNGRDVETEWQGASGKIPGFGVIESKKGVKKFKEKHVPSKYHDKKPNDFLPSEP